MTATSTRNFGQELADVHQQLEEKNSQRDRAMATGNEAAVTRLSNEIAALEQRRRNIESSRRGLQQIAQEEGAAKDAKRRHEAHVAANALLDELVQQARELEGIEGHLLRKLAEIHHTEDRIAATLAPLATDNSNRGFVQRLGTIVGHQQIEDFLERTNLAGLGERVTKDVARARDLVDRLVALPPEEET